MKPAGVKKSISGMGYQIIPLVERQWSETDSKELIAAYKANIHRFADYSSRVRDVWNIISCDLATKGIRKTGAECDKKFRNLQTAFKKIHNDADRTESSKYQWSLYADLHDLLTSGPVLRRSKPATWLLPKSAKPSDESVYKLQVDGSSEELSDENNLRLQPISMDSFDKMNENDDLLGVLNPTDEKESCTVPLQIAPRKTYSSKRKATEIGNVKSGKRVVVVKPVDDDPDLTGQRAVSTSDEEVNLQQEGSQQNSDPDLNQEDSNSAKELDQVEPGEEHLVENDDEDTNEYEAENEPEAPSWFQSFLINYETHTKMFQEKLNKIQETQELQNTRLQHLTTKVQKIEKSINELKK